MLKDFFNKVSKLIEQNKISGIIIAFITFILIVLFSFTKPYERFDLNLYDLSFMIKPSIQEWEKLTFIDIDENSIMTLGKFPWPRRYYRTGFQTLKTVGIHSATLDIMFPDESPLEVDKKNLDKLKNATGKGTSIKQDQIDEVILNNDAIFSKGISEMNKVILSFTFNKDPLTEEILKKQRTKKFKKLKNRFYSKSSIKIPDDKIDFYKSLQESDILSISYPIPELMRTGHVFGFVNRDIDFDGSVRKVRLVTVYDGRLFFNLAVMMLIDACNADLKDVEVDPGKNIIIKNALNPRTHGKKDLIIPIDERGMMYVNWAGPGPREKSFKILPFYALLEYPKHVNLVHDLIDEEDQFKAETMARITQDLVDVKHELKNATDPDMKKQMKEMEVELEKKLGDGEKNQLLRNLYPEFSSKMNDYNNEKDHSKKTKIWKMINVLKKQIEKSKWEYAKNYKHEIEKLEESLKKKGDPKVKDQVDLLKNYYNSMELVIRVESLRDNLSLTGLTAIGTIDIGEIPIHNEYAMVGAYHNTVNTILHEKFIKKPGRMINYIIMFIISMIMGFAIQRLGARESLLTIGASFIIVNLITILLFVIGNIWLEQIGITLAMLLPSLSIASIKFINEEGQKRFIKNAFSRYLAPGVIDQIMDNPEALELGGQDREITIFFSDVAGFSGISEKLTPQELVNLLNEYLSAMTEIILKHGGTIDKYEGDAIMAFYGAPQPYEDHAKRACMAAIDMKKKLRDMQDKWRKEGKDELKVRMGMNTGHAVVGNMGSAHRMDYTAMGDSVNLASRLEGANKFYNTYVMISENTYNGVKDIVEARKLDTIRVVGKAEAIVIYELLSRKDMLPDKMLEMIDCYQKGLDFFSQRQWKKAMKMFKDGLKAVPDDGPSIKYIERCEEFSKKPPSKNWDGVYALKSK